LLGFIKINLLMVWHRLTSSMFYLPYELTGSP
jgi:hypothetical protein